MTLLALATGAPLPAQTGDQGKPPVYRYIAEWDVPRAQWAEMVKVELLADGVVTSYGLDTEDFHQQKLGRVSFYFTTSEASGIDKAGKAFDEAFEKNPALGAAFRSMTEREGHRDFLTRLRYMSIK